MKVLLSALLAGTALLWLSGCASTKGDTDPNGDVPSTIPWSRPESWEGTGALGGAMGH
jgi:hypothetical protein